MNVRNLLPILLGMLLPAVALAQGRDVRGERLVIDDNGGDGTVNTIVIYTPSPLAQNTMLAIPDIGSDTAQFLLFNPNTGSASVWLLGGNAGTTPGTDFLGTTDSTAFHLYVNNGTLNGLILNTNGSLQRDTGGIARGRGAVDLQMRRVDSDQVAAGLYSVIGGGEENIAADTASTVAGGSQNKALGYKSFIGGGDGNLAIGEYSAIAGGNENETYGWKNFIGGGDENVADYDYSVVGGGNENYAVEWGTFVGGGEHNFADGANASIVGGYINEASGEFAAVGGGVANRAYGAITAIPGGAGLRLVANSTFGYLGGNHGDNDMAIVDSNVAVFGNVDLWLANNDTAASRLVFWEAESDSGVFPSATNYTSFQAGDQTGDISYTLPTAALNGATSGTDLGTGYMESNDGGAMSWRQSVVATASNLNFGTVAAGTSSDVTVTVTGAAVGDIVNLGVDNGAVTANSCYTAWVSAADTVTIRFNNYGGVGQTPATTNTFKVQVTK